MKDARSKIVKLNIKLPLSGKIDFKNDYVGSH